MAPDDRVGGEQDDFYQALRRGGSRAGRPPRFRVRQAPVERSKIAAVGWLRSSCRAAVEAVEVRHPVVARGGSKTSPSGGGMGPAETSRVGERLRTRVE